MQPMSVWYSQRAEKALRSSRTGVTMDVSHHVVAGHQTQVHYKCNNCS